ncbi:MAG TPA: gliding motility lipoprotein GldH [Daejeonella sp.]|nr:gliding motility lipoprotein GldH [Daejeonella sp.]
MILRRSIIFSVIVFSCIWLTSCQDANTVVDTNQTITNRNWSYINKIRVPVTIEDSTADYNIYINLRHTGDYKYSNIFLRVHSQSPGGKVVTDRIEFKLAYPDGQWLGKGSGNMYSYQLPFKENYRFPGKGKYLFEIEQNMRDNPLKEITDVGLRVEKSK